MQNLPGSIKEEKDMVICKTLFFYFFTSLITASNFSPIKDPLTSQETSLSEEFSLAPILIPSNTDLISALKPSSRTSPPFRLSNYRSPINPSRSPSRWYLSSASLIDLDHFNPVICAELTDDLDVQKLLNEAILTSSPAVEFLFHKSDTFNGYQNYQATGKAAFIAIFQSPFDPSIITLALSTVVYDFVIDQSFVVLSLVNSGTGLFELTLFTSINFNDYETLDRVLNAFSANQSLAKLYPTSAQELVQGRLAVMQNLARKNLQMSGSPESSRKNIAWTKFMGLLGNLPRSKNSSPQSTHSSPLSSYNSPRSPPLLQFPSPLNTVQKRYPLLSNNRPPTIVNPDDLDNLSFK